VHLALVLPPSGLPTEPGREPAHFWCNKRCHKLEFQPWAIAF
jgi:hypothetical protein